MDTNETIKRVSAQFLGPRNYPTATATLPEATVHDYNRIFAEWKEKYPTVTHEQALRYIWIRGLASLRKAMQTRSWPDPHKEQENLVPQIRS